MSDAPSMPLPVRSYMARFVARRRWVGALRTLGQTSAAAGAWLLGSCIFERLLQLPAPIRGGMLAAGAIVCLVILARGLRRALRGAPAADTAEQIELCHGQLGQRLQTVVTQLASPEQYRGSAGMLDQLLAEVSAEVSGHNPRRLISWKPALRPWAVAMALGAAIVGLWPIEWLNMPRLMLRCAAPWRHAAAVSVTQIEELQPAGIELFEGKPLTITATVRRLGPGEVILYLSSDGKHWNHVPMAAMNAAGVLGEAGDAPEIYTFLLRSVDRDMRYYVRAGDAVSDEYEVRIKRPPVVSEWRIDYVYPSYTGKSPRTVRNNTGFIEAPARTQVTLSAVVTEPLSAAYLLMDGGRKISMSASEQPNVWRAGFEVTRDLNYSVHMTSDRGVEGRGPGNMPIRVLWDRPPVVRVLMPQRQGQLAANDVVAIRFEATDDYGVATASLRCHVNGVLARGLSITSGLDARRAIIEFNVDLSELNLRPGDAVSFYPGVEDAAGQKAGSESPYHVLIAPEAVGSDLSQRAAALKHALDHLGTWVEQVDQMRAASATTVPTRPANPGDASVSLHRLISVSMDESAAMRRALLVAIAHGDSTAFCRCLAAWADEAAGRSAPLATLQTEPEAAASQWIKDASAGLRDLHRRMKIVSDGQLAELLLIERRNLKSLESLRSGDKTADRPERKRALERARQDIGQLAGLLDAGGRDAEVNALLRAKIDAAQQALRSQKSPSVLAAARAWAALLRRDGTSPAAVGAMAPRLLTASQAQALAPRANAALAGALHMASRAAAGLVERRASRADDEAAFVHAVDAFSAAVSVTETAYRRRHWAYPARAIEAMEWAAAAARRALAELSPQAPASAAAQTPVVSQSEEAASSAAELAMSANAAMMRGDYASATIIDAQLSALLQNRSQDYAITGDDTAQAMEIAQELERLMDAQRRINADSQAAAAGAVEQGAAVELAGRQRDVAGAIERLDKAWCQLVNCNRSAGGTRHKQLAAGQAAREQLAALRGQVEEMRAAVRGGAASQPASPVRNDGPNRGGTRKGNKPHAPAAGTAVRLNSESRRRLADLAKAIDPSAMRRLEETLRSLDVATAASLEKELSPAMQTLRQGLKQAIDQGDSAAADAAIERAWQSVMVVEAVASAQDASLLRADPLDAAAWMTQSAADALADFHRTREEARILQDKALGLMGQAWDRARRHASRARLATSAPLRQMIYPRPEIAPAAASASAVSWSSPRGRDARTIRAGDAIETLPREPDPPGYEEAIKAYFDILAQRGEVKNRR